MADRDEALYRLAADSPRGTIGRDQLRVGRLDFFEFFEQAIEVAIGNLRLIFDVVPVVVVVNELPKLCHASSGGRNRIALTVFAHYGGEASSPDIPAALDRSFPRLRMRSRPMLRKAKTAIVASS